MERDERAFEREVPVTKAKRRIACGCAAKLKVPYPVRSRECLKGQRNSAQREVSRSRSSRHGGGEGLNVEESTRNVNLVTKRPQMSAQAELPFVPRGEAADGKRSEEAVTAASEAEGSGTSGLMECVLSRTNMLAALKRVRTGGATGSAGVDRMTVEALPEYLKKHWPKIREELLLGRYEPKPVRYKEIPKPNGGVRQLGIPTVMDRLIQQALLQVLQPAFERTFSEHSYGFRPGRSALQAVEQAVKYVRSGKQHVVDVDLEKFFDRVDHDVLMGKLAKRIPDKRVLLLIRKYLKAGVMHGEVVLSSKDGTPQGGPLSALLANVMLDELDKALEAKGRAFIRYADDCNVYVANPRVGERVLKQMRRVFARLKLKVNEEKTAVAHVNERKLLGYQIRVDAGRCRAIVAMSAEKRFKAEVKKRTRRSHKTLEETIRHLAPLLRGWGNYFRLAPRRQLKELDQKIQRRLRVLILRQWKNGARAARMLKHLGAPGRKIYFEFSKPKLYGRHWYVSDIAVVRIALSSHYFASKGLPLLAP